MEPRDHVFLRKRRQHKREPPALLLLLLLLLAYGKRNALNIARAPPWS